MASDRATINQTMAVPCFSVVCVLVCDVSYCYISMLMHVCVHIYGYCLAVSPFVPALVRFSVTCESIDAIRSITSRWRKRARHVHWEDYADVAHHRITRPEVHQQLPSMGLTVVVIRIITPRCHNAIKGHRLIPISWRWNWHNAIEAQAMHSKTTITWWCFLLYVCTRATYGVQLTWSCYQSCAFANCYLRGCKQIVLAINSLWPSISSVARCHVYVTACVCMCVYMCRSITWYCFLLLLFCCVDACVCTTYTYI